MSEQTPKAEPLKKEKMSKAQWLEVKARAEAGEAYESIAARFPIGTSAIVKKAVNERWVTPRRLQKGLRGELSANDPASAAAAVWAERKQDARETVFQGARKSLERFFAMAPVPQSFGEAAIANKLMNDAISPPEEQASHTNVNLAVLTQANFSPRMQE
jgi:hypothetical protein